MGKNKAKRKKKIFMPEAYSEDVALIGSRNEELPSSSSSSLSRNVVLASLPSTSVSCIGSIPVTKNEERKRLERMSRFSSYSDDDDDDGLMFVSPASKKLKRSRLPSIDENNEGFGTSQKLEKAYLRLTSAPKPADVRPLRVLKLALEHVKHQYQADDQRNYKWTNEQFKSIRQDLTVQNLTRTAFSLSVYETHARISLEHGDLNEFNQCQTVIQTQILVPLSNLDNQPQVKQSKKSMDEFAAYRLLYALVQKEWADVKAQMTKISLQHKIRKSCFHSLQVVDSVLSNNFFKFFQLYNSDNCPNLSGYLMDFLLQRVRLSAYPIIISAYRPKLDVRDFAKFLSFEDEDEAIHFLQCETNAVLIKIDLQGVIQMFIDCKASR